MNYDWQTDLRPRSRAAALVPPTVVDETAWDILLALHDDGRAGLDLDKLGGVISVPQHVLTRWLALLEQRELISAVTSEFSSEVRAALTPAGRNLLDRYLSAASELQLGTRH